MQLRARTCLARFQQLLDEIDAPARTVQLVAEKLIRRTGRCAESTMHAAAKNRLRIATFGAVADEFGEVRFQNQSPG